MEFPEATAVDALWIAADGAGLVARSGDRALVAWRKGDGYVARDLAWTDALAAKAEKRASPSRPPMPRRAWP